ncbi:MAG: ATP-binding cassette domain-containing protein [Acidobacteriota bacterium]|nr:ATP-binding cassette domain-containing protein [Acidobacteriota bacterium]
MRHRIGALEIDASFVLTQPWTLLFGPSGSGKTTILRAIAGLVRPAQGRITSTMMPGTLVEQKFTLLDTDKGIFVPAHNRVIRFAAQKPNLFPNLTVRENLIYGIRRTGPPGDFSDWEDKVRFAMEQFGLAPLAAKYPSQLSGGEAQRLNLARADTALDCRLLMLDEPFTGIDATQQTTILSYLTGKAEKEKRTILSVTHDVAEAFQLGAEVIKIADGRVVAQGPVEVVLAEERKRLLEQLRGS